MSKPTISVEEAKRKRAEREKAKREEKTGNGKSNGHAREPRFKLLGLDDLDLKPDEDWVIDGVLPSKGVGMIYGKYKAYKSFAALDMAWAVADAMRREWGGRRILKHGAVIYIACEGQLGVRKRLLAMKLRQGDDELPIFKRIEARPRLGMSQAIDAGEIVYSIRQVFPHDVIALVVIDTAARTLFDEETNKTLSAFLDNCEDVSDQLDCLVLAVHHEGLDPSRPRGGTMLPAGTVVQLHIKRKGQRFCQLFVEEAKDTESGIGFDIELQGFEFGSEHDEHRDSTLIVTKVEAMPVQQEPEQEPRKKSGRPNKSKPLLATTFNQSLHNHGIEFQVPDQGPRVKAVNRDYAKNVYVRRRSDLTPKDAEREFNKALGKALELEEIVSCEVGGICFLFWAGKIGPLL